jgi:hypothetical protein
VSSLGDLVLQTRYKPVEAGTILMLLQLATLLDASNDDAGGAGARLGAIDGYQSSRALSRVSRMRMASSAERSISQRMPRATFTGIRDRDS